MKQKKIFDPIRTIINQAKSSKFKPVIYKVKTLRTKIKVSPDIIDLYPGIIKASKDVDYK